VFEGVLLAYLNTAFQWNEYSGMYSMPDSKEPFQGELASFYF